MIRSAINRLLGNQPEAAPEQRVEVAPDPRGAPGSRVHHEYFVGDAPEPSDNQWPWLCRVYAANGAVNEQSGRAPTQESARNAALSWAAKTKAALRGEA